MEYPSIVIKVKMIFWGDINKCKDKNVQFIFYFYNHSTTTNEHNVNVSIMYDLFLECYNPILCFCLRPTMAEHVLNSNDYSRTLFSIVFCSYMDRQTLGFNFGTSQVPYI